MPAERNRLVRLKQGSEAVAASLPAYGRRRFDSHQLVSCDVRKRRMAYSFGVLTRITNRSQAVSLRGLPRNDANILSGPLLRQHIPRCRALAASGRPTLIEFPESTI